MRAIHLHTPTPLLSQHHLPVSIQPGQNKQHHTESEQGGTPITHKGQGNADHGREADGHTNIDRDMEEEYRGHAIGIGPAEDTSLPFGDGDDPHEQDHIDTQEYNTAHKTKSLPDRAENKVRPLLRHKIITGLGALNSPLPKNRHY